MTVNFHDLVGTGLRVNIGKEESCQPTAIPIPPDIIGHQLPSQGTSWAASGEIFYRIGESHRVLPSGVYRPGQVPGIGPTFARVKNDTDKLVRFPDSASEQILQEITAFQSMKKNFAKHGFLFKRGVLLWGPPGSGKTATVQFLVKLIIEQANGVAVIIEDPSLAAAGLQMLRAVEPDRQVIALMEDIDSLIERFGENQYLALLDGESQVDNIVFVATTNYPARLDARLVDRPSRFDTIRYIGMPSAAAREAYFAAKTPNLLTDQMRAFVEASDGYSVAHMRELIILTQCFGLSLTEAKRRLDTARKNKPDETKRPDRLAFGFAA